MSIIAFGGYVQYGGYGSPQRLRCVHGGTADCELMETADCELRIDGVIGVMKTFTIIMTTRKKMCENMYAEG